MTYSTVTVMKLTKDRIIYLGRVARNLLANGSVLDPMAGSIAYVLGVFVSLLMWSFGLIWLAFALATIYHCSPFPFNMGWWGFTFPLGVYAANTIQLGIEMEVMFFKVFGTVCGTGNGLISSADRAWQILSGAVGLLWLVVACRTVHGAWQGSLFFAPCLQNLKWKEEDSDMPTRQA